MGHGIVLIHFSVGFFILLTFISHIELHSQVARRVSAIFCVFAQIQGEVVLEGVQGEDLVVVMEIAFGVARARIFEFNLDKDAGHGLHQECKHAKQEE